MQVGDGQADFLSDLRASGLLGAPVLVDMAGHWSDADRGRRTFEDEQPGR